MSDLLSTPAIRIKRAKSLCVLDDRNRIVHNRLAHFDGTAEFIKLRVSVVMITQEYTPCAFFIGLWSKSAIFAWRKRPEFLSTACSADCDGHFSLFSNLWPERKRQLFIQAIQL